MRIAKRVILPIAAASALGMAALGCGPEPVRAPNPTRSLDERRAVEVIRRAVSLESERPGPARDVPLPSGKTLRIDVSVEGHEFGVAYISDDDRETLGDAIKPPNGRDEKLRLERVGPEGDVRVVLLYEENYRYDDLAGESHELTTITAERALTRDVRDFITYARTKKFK